MARCRLYLTQAPALEEAELDEVLKPLPAALNREALRAALGRKTHILIAQGDARHELEQIRTALERVGCAVYLAVELETQRSGKARDRAQLGGALALGVVCLVVLGSLFAKPLARLGRVLFPPPPAPMSAAVQPSASPPSLPGLPSPGGAKDSGEARGGPEGQGTPPAEAAPPPAEAAPPPAEPAPPPAEPAPPPASAPPSPAPSPPQTPRAPPAASSPKAKTSAKTRAKASAKAKAAASKRPAGKAPRGNGSPAPRGSGKAPKSTREEAPRPAAATPPPGKQPGHAPGAAPSAGAAADGGAPAEGPQPDGGSEASAAEPGADGGDAPDLAPAHPFSRYLASLPTRVRPPRPFAGLLSKLRVRGARVHPAPEAPDLGDASPDGGTGDAAAPPEPPRRAPLTPPILAPALSLLWRFSQVWAGIGFGIATLCLWRMWRLQDDAKQLLMLAVLLLLSLAASASLLIYELLGGDLVASMLTTPLIYGLTVCVVPLARLLYRAVRARGKESRR